MWVALSDVKTGLSLVAVVLNSTSPVEFYKVLFAIVSLYVVDMFVYFTNILVEYLSLYIKTDNIHLIMVTYCVGPPLWSSGQSSWLQIRRPGFDSRHYQGKK
jgi:hypothetical protein